jgi:hypothetical protein
VSVDAPDTPLDSPLGMTDVMESPRYRDLWTARLAPGDPAFDFELPRLDGAGGPSTESVRLSSFAGERPVALIFGSYT